MRSSTLWIRRAVAAFLVATVGAVPAQTSGPLGANLPRLGDSSGQELSPTAERRLGETAMLQIRRDPDYLDDPEVDDWLNGFGQRLVQAVPGGVGDMSFEFFALRDRSLNAFALPGGFIGVHSGLLLAAANESEIASVLGHEIGHVTQRHIARSIAQQSQAMPLMMASMLLAVLAARASPNAAMGLGTLGQTMAISKMLAFSRDAEREADRVGFETLREAGFDAAGSVSFFSRLQQASRAYDNPAAPAYLRSHPVTSERIADMQARTLGLVPRAVVDSPDFFMMRARLKVLENARSQQNPNKDGLRDAAAFFQQALAEHSMPDAAAYYGLALVEGLKRDQRGAGAFNLALGRAQQALPGGHPWLDRLAIDFRRESGDAGQSGDSVGAADPDSAVSLASASRARFPDSRAIAHAEARALLAANTPALAVERIGLATARWSNDARLWDQLALAYGAQGKRALAHHAAGEAAARRRNWQVAYEQMRFAQRAGDTDFISASMIDARLRVVQGEALREREELGGNVR